MLESPLFQTLPDILVLIYYSILSQHLGTFHNLSSSSQQAQIHFFSYLAEPVIFHHKSIQHEPLLFVPLFFILLNSFTYMWKSIKNVIFPTGYPIIMGSVFLCQGLVGFCTEAGASFSLTAVSQTCFWFMLPKYRKYTFMKFHMAAFCIIFMRFPVLGYRFLTNIYEICSNRLGKDITSGLRSVLTV